MQNADSISVFDALPAEASAALTAALIIAALIYIAHNFQGGYVSQQARQEQKLMEAIAENEVRAIGNEKRIFDLYRIFTFSDF